jgi:hypothetical protein
MVEKQFKKHLAEEHDGGAGGERKTDERLRPAATAPKKKPMSKSRKK